MQQGPEQQIPNSSRVNKASQTTPDGGLVAPPNKQANPLKVVNLASHTTLLQVVYGECPERERGMLLEVVAHVKNEQHKVIGSYVYPLQVIDREDVAGIDKLCESQHLPSVFKRLIEFTTKSGQGNWYVHDVGMPTSRIPYCTSKMPPLTSIASDVSLASREFTSSRRIDGEQLTLDLLLDSARGMVVGHLYGKDVGERDPAQSRTYLKVRVLSGVPRDSSHETLERALISIAREMAIALQLHDSPDIAAHLKSKGFIMLIDPADDRELAKIDMSRKYPELLQGEELHHHRAYSDNTRGVRFTLSIGNTSALFQARWDFNGDRCIQSLFFGSDEENSSLHDIHLQTLLRAFERIVSGNPWEQNKQVKEFEQLFGKVKNSLYSSGELAQRRSKEGVLLLSASTNLNPFYLIPPIVKKSLIGSDDISVVPPAEDQALISRLRWLCREEIPMQFKLRPRYNFTDANAFTDLVIAANLSGGFSVLLKNCYGGSVLIPDCDGGNPIGTAAGDERYLEIIRVFRSQFSTGWQGAERQLTALAAKGGDLPNAGVPFRKNLPSLESDHEQEAYAKACELAWRFYEKAGIEFLCVGVSIGPEGYAWTKVSSSRTSSFSPDIEFGVTPDGLVAVRVWGYWNKGEVPRTGSGGLRSTLVDDFMLLKPVPFSSELIIELENSLAEYHKSNSFSPLSWNIVGQLSTYPKIFKTLADLRLQ